MKTQIKLDKRTRIAQIMVAALDLCAKPNATYLRITRDEIARKAGIPPTLIAYHIGTMATLRRDIMREAVRVGCLPVIAQGLAARDRHAMKAPKELQERALQSLVN